LAQSAPSGILGEKQHHLRFPENKGKIACTTTREMRRAKACSRTATYKGNASHRSVELFHSWSASVCSDHDSIKQYSQQQHKKVLPPEIMPKNLRTVHNLEKMPAWCKSCTHHHILRIPTPTPPILTAVRLLPTHPRIHTRTLFHPHPTHPTRHAHSHHHATYTQVYTSNTHTSADTRPHSLHTSTELYFHAAWLVLARTVCTHCMWAYIWWNPCQNYRMYTIHYIHSGQPYA